MTHSKNKNYVDNTFNNPSILSLCPGIRGLERGLERAIGRIRTVAYVEIEAFIIENLVSEMEQGLLAPAPIWPDIKTFDGRPFRNKIHGIIGGYPCQPFSTAGQRNGTEDPRHLYPFISGIIKAARPLWCFFENVEGHLSLGYAEVSADLRTMGYSVEAGIYSAEEVGAPHERNRLFILAIREDVAYASCLGWFAEQERLEQIERNEIGQFSANECAGRNEQCGIIKSSSIGEAELGDTSIAGLQESRPGNVGELPREGGFGICDRLEQTSSEKMADTINIGWEAGRPDSSRSDVYTGNENNRPEVKELRGIRGKEELAYAYGRGSGEDREQGELRATSAEQPSGDSGTIYERENSEGRFNRWPARPGERQYDWEEPRVKPRLGSAVNGYNFREDFLRALGNSVVEQTAEIAFLDLLRKHMENLQAETTVERSVAPAADRLKKMTNKSKIMENELPLNTSPKISRGNITERGGMYYQNISYSYIKGTEIKVKLQGRTREDVEISVEEFIKTL